MLKTFIVFSFFSLSIACSGQLHPSSQSSLAADYTLYVLKSGNGAGSVANSQGSISCGDICEKSYAAGEMIDATFTATAAPGSVFLGWRGLGCTGTGTCAVKQTITSKLELSANFSLANSPGPNPSGPNCGTTANNVQIVDTGDMSTGWARHTFEPSPETIIALKFSVPASPAIAGGVTATRTSAANFTKLIVISSCPGSLEPLDGQQTCLRYAVESNTLSLTSASSTPNSIYECKVKPGQIYYANLVSKTKLSAVDYSCSDTYNCSVFASRSAPYQP